MDTAVIIQFFKSLTCSLVMLRSGPLTILVTFEITMATMEEDTPARGSFSCSFALGKLFTDDHKSTT